MQHHLKNIAFTITAVVAVMLQAPAQADNLLTSANQTQLDSWLGQPGATLTNIFTKTAGATSQDFHTAVDGKGRTITLMEASNDAGQTWLVGGYDPQSWSSAGGFNFSPDGSARSAFIFNLSSGVKYAQTPNFGGPEDFGKYQTYNDPTLGPTFGFGSDLRVGQDLTHGGQSSLISYCDLNCNTAFVSLLDGSANTNVTYGALEVFTITAVPEPAEWGMLGLGLLAVAGVARRRGVR